MNTTATAASAWAFYPRCDVVSLGHDEDGDEIFGRSWYVLAEHEDGRRMRHDFCDVHRHHTETDVPPRIASLAARIVANPPVLDGNRRWHPTYPRYGSRPWESEQPDELQREREDDRCGMGG